MHGMLTDGQIATFLHAYAQCGIITDACATANVSYAQIKKLRDTDGDFQAAFEDAEEQFADSMERVLFDRATNGYDTPLTHQGQLSYQLDWGYVDPLTGEKPPTPPLLRDAQGRPIPVTIKKHSDALIMFVNKGLRKRRYAERTEITGADGKPLEGEQDEAKRIARIQAILNTAKERVEASKDLA